LAGFDLRTTHKRSGLFLCILAYLDVCTFVATTAGGSRGREWAICRVARWFIFIPKIPIWVNFGLPLNGKYWYRYCLTIRNILRPFGIFYDHSEYFTNIWNIYDQLGIFYGRLLQFWPFGIVCCHLVYSSCFGMFGPRKIWQPWRCALSQKTHSTDYDKTLSSRFRLQSQTKWIRWLPAKVLNKYGLRP
jgi:hypothetical protein